MSFSKRDYFTGETVQQYSPLSKVRAISSTRNINFGRCSSLLARYRFNCLIVVIIKNSHKDAYNIARFINVG